jgi:hypothetical protein
MEGQDHPRRVGADRSGDGASAEQACGARTKRGAPCRSFALPSGQFCLSHDPERQETVREARAKGGAAASKIRALEGRRARLDTPTALVRFTGKLIQDVLDQTTPVDVGRAVLYGISIQRQLVESGDLEKRLSALEARLESKGTKRWSA